MLVIQEAQKPTKPQRLEHDTGKTLVIAVPADVAVCQHCGKPIYAVVDDFENMHDGSFKPKFHHEYCSHDPGQNYFTWAGLLVDWEDKHPPYYYQDISDDVVYEWLLSAYVIVDPGRERKLLAKWKKASGRPF